MQTGINLLRALVASSCTFLIFNVQQVSAQSPNKIAQAMIAANRPGEAYSITVEGSRGKGILQLNSTAYGLLRTDSKELGEKGWAQPWHDQINRLQVSTGSLTDVIHILGCPGLASNGKITRERFTTYVSRLKFMSPEMVQRWRIASNQIQTNVSGLILVGLLVAHDSLFAGSDSLALGIREQLEFNRFKSIPIEVIKTWATTLKRPFIPEYVGQSAPYDWSGIPPSIDIAFQLLSVDGLFVNDIFQQSVFEAALPIAKKQLMLSTGNNNPIQEEAITSPNTKSTIVNTVAEGDTRTKSVEFIDDNTYLLVDISNDSTYAFDKSNPVKVGGSNENSGPKNERRFLNALVGPNGEEIKYIRTGSCCFFKTPNGLIGNTGMLDIYKVYWSGSKDTINIYINAYDKGDLKIPFGLTAKKKN